MSTILLPASRRSEVNLYPPETGGVVSSSDVSSAFADSILPSGRLDLRDLGLSAGDVVSASADIRVFDPEQGVYLDIRFQDAAGNLISTVQSAVSSPTTFTRFEVHGAQIPAGTRYMILIATRSGTLVSGTAIRNGMINRGPTAQPYDIPKRGAWTPIVRGLIARNNEQAVQRFLSGAQQLTSYASRRWLLQFQTPTLEGDELREWELVLGQLSDLSNVFRFVPPRYTGPSTGYEGANPVVNGASQTGTSLVCDGVDASTDIVDKGDWLSYEVTSSGGQTNVQLHQVTALATSDASGNVTISITPAIRLSPADNATVQIFAPTGQFRFAQPSAGIDLQLLRRSAIAVEAEEAIWL